MGEPATKSAQNHAVSSGSGDNSMEEILASIRKIITAEEKESTAGNYELPKRSESIVDAEIPANPSQDDLRMRGGMNSGGEPKTGPLSALAAKLKAPGRDRPDEFQSRREDDPGPSEGISRSTEAAGLSTKPVAETPSSNPGGLAALAARTKNTEAPANVVSEGGDDSGTKPASSGRAVRSSGRSVAEAPGAPQTSPRGTSVSLADIAAMASGRDGTMQNTPEPEADTERVNFAKTNEVVSGKNGLGPDEKPANAGSEAATRSEVEEKREVEFKEALIAPSTQAAVKDSINRLKHSIAEVDAAHAEAVLRPMLKEWLDNNLPSMVENIVQQEITSLIKKTGS